ncbi:unnamed protein product [Durusdinium trenchii]|uniref:Uncharacterized protein n=1 Tax=Durusdinium trenchii TaxID=1381693 RepID=A0ABP0SZR6_9DINO
MAVKDIERSKEDPQVLKDLYTLSNLGTKGKHANNIHAELMSKVEHVPKIPKPFKAKVPLKGFPDSVQSMLLPHEMFACLYRNYKKVWSTAVVPSVERVQKFWRAMRLHPQMRDHPMTSSPQWESWTVPIAVHGDGVPVTGVGKVWSRVMTNYSWYSLLGYGTTPSMLMWVWGFFDKLKVGDQASGTLLEFYSILRWSFLALSEGRYKEGSVEALRAGSWLAGGWKGVLWALTGDLDYFNAMLGTPNYSAVGGPCMHCKCTGTGAATWTDFRPQAMWRNTRWEADVWRNWDERSKCILLTLPGARCWSIAYDWVHVKYLGVDQYIFGSVMALLRITFMLKQNVHLEEMITFHKDDFALPPGPAQEFEETANSMLLLLSQVADHFVEEGMKCFDITSKCHMLQELAILSRSINPKVTWCFMGEDQMQRMQQVAKACVRGNKLDKQTTKLARHYRLGLHLHYLDLAA